MPYADVDNSADTAHLVDYLERAATSLAPIKDELRRHLRPSSWRPVLDLGCGAGHDLVAFASEGVEAVGVDPSSVMLAASAARGRRDTLSLRLAGARGEELPFRSQSFAGCLLDRVLQHVADPSRVLAEVVRVLQPGAPVGLFEPDWGSLSLNADDQGLCHLLSEQLARRVPQGRIGLYLTRLLHQTGFTDLDWSLKPARPKNLEGLFALTASAERAMSALVEEGTVEAERMAAFRHQLEELSAAGSFLASMNRMVVTGRAPAGQRRELD